MLTALAREGQIKMPRFIDFQTKSGIASTTIKQSLEYLLRNDYIYKTFDDAFTVLDPLIKYILVNS